MRVKRYKVGVFPPPLVGEGYGGAWICAAAIRDHPPPDSRRNGASRPPPQGGRQPEYAARPSQQYVTPTRPSCSLGTTGIGASCRGGRAAATAPTPIGSGSPKSCCS